MFTNHVCIIYVYKQDFALNNLHGLIYYKIQPNETNDCENYLVKLWQH